MKVKIQVPESLREISLEQYQKYHKINTEDNKNSNFLLHKTIEIFCNLNLQNVIKVEFNSVVKVVNMINDLFTQDVKLVPTFTMDGVGYGFVPDLDKMTLGEYVDLDNTLGDWDNMHKAMAVLYRPIDDTYKDKYIIKDYDPDVDKDKYKQMPLDIVMGSIVFFLQFKERVIENYPEIFESGGDKDLDYSAERNFTRKWGWYNSLYRLAGGDATKIDEV